MQKTKLKRLTLNIPIMLCGIGGKYYCTTKHPDIELTLVDSSYVMIERPGHESQAIPLNDVRQFTIAPTPPGPAVKKKKTQRKKKAV
jgi:hypothetical protein